MKAIYCIINKITGKRYVGSAVDFYGRKRQHLSHLRRGIHHSPYLQRSWDKYKEENFDFIILETVEKKENLILREQWWIDNTPSEYNACKIAGSSLGIKRRPETLKKIRLAILGVKHPEWRNKIKSEAQGGKNHWQYGKKMPESVKKKKSDSLKKLYETGFHPRHKQIVQMSLEGKEVETWKSLKDAADKLGFNADSISNNLCNRSKTAHGYKWKYSGT